MPVNEEEIAEGVVVTDISSATGIETVAIDELGSRLDARFQVWHTERQNTETRWIDNMKAYYRKHPAIVQSKIKEGRSDAFLGVTKLKTNAGYARLLSAFGDPKHWSITPTPLPDLHRNAAIDEDVDRRTQFVLNAVELPEDPTEQAKAIINIRKATVDQINAEKKEVAEQTTKRMGKLINDQLVEANYATILRRSLFQASMLGNGCIKAGDVKIKQKVTFNKNAEGESEVGFKDEVVPGIEGVSVLDLFPDPDAIEPEGMTGIYQRHALSRAELGALKQLTGFDAAVIDKIIEENPNGKYTPLSYELEVESVGDQKTRTDTRNRYEVLEYWGDMQDAEILSALDPESLKEGAKFDDFNQINVWIVCGRVIRVGYLKSLINRLPYYIFPYDIALEQFWATGVPESMKGSQKDINTAIRMTLDCAAFNHIPNLEVNGHMLKPGHSITVAPGKVWVRMGGDPAFDAVKALKFPNIIPELLNIVSVFRGIIDEETNLPALVTGTSAPGQASLGRTASGLSMVLGTANIVGQATVKNVDDFLIRPMMKALYLFNMEWSSDESVKGDMNVNARGTSTLQAKEIELNQLVNFANITDNETDQVLTNRDELLKSIAEKMNLDPDKFLKTADEVQAIIEAQQNDPETKERVSLELQKLSAEVEAQLATADKNKASIVNDSELLAIRKAELSAELLEKANQIESGQNADSGDAEGITSLESVNQNDGIESNNESA